ITRSHPTWTRIAPQGIRKEGLYQVFAPNQNENVYTNDWTGPFYGYERVIETFELTETPLRVKPINIYYHTYAASKPASLNALRKVYDWAMKQPTTPVHASEYIRKVHDFEGAVVARELDDGALIVRSGGALRTLRVAPDALPPDLAASSGVAGVASGPGGRYLTLAGAQARIVAARAGAATPPGVAEANGRIDALARLGGNLEFTLTSHVAPTFRLHDAASCSVTINGRTARPAPGTQTYDTDPAGAGRAPHQQVVRVRCVQ
ncbi:MAG: hypothetical protein JNM79_03080, partial [Burkholderiales bacterium]|nr:hypothetical protein [Burkholderiales bacterium]